MKDDTHEVVYKDDCPLFYELNQKLNFSEHPKIKRSQRDWIDVADEMLKSSDKFIAIPYLHELGISTQEEFKRGVRFLAGFFGAFVLTLIICLLTSFSYLGFLIIGLSIVLSVGVIFIYRLPVFANACLYWWRHLRNTPRSLIETDETVDFCIEQLSVADYQKQNFSNLWLGNMTDFEIFVDHYQTLRDYKEMLKRNESRTKEVDDRSGSKISSRLRQVTKILNDVDERIIAAGDTAKELRDELLPAYKQEAEKVKPVIEDISQFHDGNDELLHRIQQVLRKSRQPIIDKFSFILNSLSEARDITDEYLREHSLLKGDVLQPTGYSLSRKRDTQH